MTLLRLRYVQRYRDRHGVLRHYLRRPGATRIVLPGLPGSPEFMAAYTAGIAAGPLKKAIGADRTAAGSLDALAVLWLQSSAIKQLRATTAQVYRRILAALRAEHGDKPVAMLEAKHIRRIIDKRADTPAAANHVLRTLRTLMKFAVQEGWVQSDPTLGVVRLREAGTRNHSWTEEEIAAYEARWPSGSRERLALALLLYTGQRRSDVVRMGRQHVAGAVMEVRQVKSGGKTLVVLPLHPDLIAEMAKAPRDQLTFLRTDGGAAFTGGGFYNAFIEWSRAAGLPAGRSPHGLRRAICRRLAEAGATGPEIMAITGHKRLADVEPYIRAVAQQKLAVSAIARIGEAGGKAKK